jgi:FkbM family methyltransferase
MEIFQVLRRHSDQAVVLDVGAWAGDTAKIFSELGFEVWAFEPQDTVFKALLHNSKFLKRVHPIKAIVGNEGRSKYMGFLEPGNSGSGYYQSDKGGKPNIVLDFYCKDFKHVDLIKIDIEGTECLALDGAVKIIEKFSPILVIEVNGKALKRHGYAPASIFSRVQDLGYVGRPLMWPERRGTSAPWDMICRKRKD